ncbi:Interleukin-1 receptor type 2 [Merluccius polli]|uniref:Interleukin-1 receptor type 2 n=1 Tax=Merluccius polli TaxID=89951 RepID=A0AA47NX81_MERPO|nr:Interleukin-1 receptor type 2 [Merluccius polli]
MDLMLKGFYWPTSCPTRRSALLGLPPDLARAWSGSRVCEARPVASRGSPGVAATCRDSGGFRRFQRDGCFRVSPEVALYRREGEAVALTWHFLHRVLQVRNFASPNSTYLISKGNATGGVAEENEGRVQQNGMRLWLLPSQSTDSGEYTCYYRTQSICVAGSLSLQVYPEASVDVSKLLYSHPTSVGQPATVYCPSISSFSTIQRVEWFKGSRASARPLRSASPGVDLLLPTVGTSELGLYTCLLMVLIDQSQYRVSRIVLLHPEVPHNLPLGTTSDPSVTSYPSINPTDKETTVDRPPPPVISAPLNGTVYYTADGSELELRCEVWTGCQSTDSTLVTWLADGQSLDSAYLDGWALQGERRVTQRMTGGCQVEVRLIVALTDRETEAEFKCVTQNEGGTQEVVVQLRLADPLSTWLVVAFVVSCCFLLVVSVFLYFLMKPQRKADYFLARQTSIC